jgi:PAP2 superfamily
MQVCKASIMSIYQTISQITRVKVFTYTKIKNGRKGSKSSAKSFAITKFFTTSSFSLIILISIINTSNATITSLPIVITTQNENYLQIDSNIGSNNIISWNKLISELGMKVKLSPPEFSRAYSLVHISIYDSLLAARDDMTNLTVNESLSRSFYVSSMTEAASEVMNYLFPNDHNKIRILKYSQIDQFQDGKNQWLESGLKLGNKVAKAVIDYAKKDNSDFEWSGTVSRIGKCIWNGTNPVNPMAGFWKTYVLKSGSEIQPHRPETCNSQGDILDLVQTYEAWKQRTPKQTYAVHYWGDQPPPVVWNNILNEQVLKSNMSIFNAAFSNVYLNVGMYDALVSCWYAKYNYWTARPFQRISNITTEIPTPNFPGYPSGHSVISIVAGRVLGEIFPDKKDYFYNQAMEAGLSRLWAGIHFKQDITNGMEQGNKIAEKIVSDMHKVPHPFIFN